MKYRIISPVPGIGAFETDNLDEAYMAWATLVVETGRKKSRDAGDGRLVTREGKTQMIGTVSVAMAELTAEALKEYPAKEKLEAPYVIVAVFEETREMIGVAEGFSLTAWQEVSEKYFAKMHGVTDTTFMKAGKEANEILGSKYAVMVDGEFVWRGDKKMECIIQFVKHVIVAGSLEGANAMSSVTFEQGPFYLDTNKQSVKALLDNELVAAMIGVTWNDWIALGPSGVDQDGKPVSKGLNLLDRKDLSPEAIGALEEILETIESTRAKRLVDDLPGKKNPNSPWGAPRVLH